MKTEAEWEQFEKDLAAALKEDESCTDAEWEEFIKDIPEAEVDENGEAVLAFFIKNKKSQKNPVKGDE